MIPALLSVIAAFLLGAVPFGYLIGRVFRGIDIRAHGSGNPGATNALRVLGPGPGVATFLLDTAKGWLPPFLALHAAAGEPFAFLLGTCAVAGHMFTPFLGFRGGKGVATAAGVFAALLPTEAAIAFGVFCALLALFRYVSLGSIAAALLLPVTAALFGRPLWLVTTTAVVAAAIIAKHRSNIMRLINGTENKFMLRRKGT